MHDNAEPSRVAYVKWIEARQTGSIDKYMQRSNKSFVTNLLLGAL